MAPVCVVAWLLGGCTRIMLNYFKFVERRLRSVGRLFLGAKGGGREEKSGGRRQARKIWRLQRERRSRGSFLGSNEALIPTKHEVEFCGSEPHFLYLTRGLRTMCCQFRTKDRVVQLDSTLNSCSWRNSTQELSNQVLVETNGWRVPGNARLNPNRLP